MFIVIEGIDGTGKSTQANRLADHFRALGREVILDFEPTRGPHGMKLRASLTARRSLHSRSGCGHSARPHRRAG